MSESCSTVLAKTIISLNFIRRKKDRHFLRYAQPIEEFLESEWPLNQLIEEWVQNLSTLTYQEIEWRALWMIRSMVLIGCSGHLWVPLIGI
ncbi:hypothetical protein Goshw_018001 [Gossypium schwendimanii]|uniref:Uncharacterized protein n=1 Tax=Gossypium schwendimanii TaxID=34291 RepID=A0A7J9M575_GOSSC|nr:hypothetical protein [Gossypium schwendimanii]